MFPSKSVLASATIPIVLALSACNTASTEEEGKSPNNHAIGGASNPTGTAGGATKGGNSGQGGSSGKGGSSTKGSSKSEPDVTTAVKEEIPAILSQALAQAKSLDGTGLLSAYPTETTGKLNYDATTATGMSLIQASSLSLDPSELEILGKNGLVISKRHEFPSFAYGYKSIYFEDLPVYVSADSILEAVHRTFDSLLASTEQLALMGELSRLLQGMRGRIATSTADEATKTDAELYLSVAEGLLNPNTATTTATSPDATQFISLATAGEGHSMVKLFGVERDEDFSQFKPRGHYVNTEALQRYFRAMMWLGRVDLRLIETNDDGTQTFHRRQFDAAVALRELMWDAEFKLWTHIDDTIGAYVGEHDSMTPKTLGDLMAALKVTNSSEASKLSDAQIVEELKRGNWGAQRIASRLITNNTSDDRTLPLDRSFLLFGQRYTVDSETFVNVTYDRVPGRLMPNPLDAAFAALGNNAALPILSPEFNNTGYVQGLAKTRTLVDAHEAAYWEGSIYTRWLSSLRSLSPQMDSDLPSIAKTPAWQTRILSTQLASWAELRHDTILYAKPSYSSIHACEFPDAYVDPYPEFYAKLGGIAQTVGAVAELLPSTAASLKDSTKAWVSNFTQVTANLQKMAEDQRSGNPHSAELISFINDAVKWDEQVICGTFNRSNLAGWYLKLYLSQTSGLDADPVVADVHTQPTDAAGNDVGRILHVGTGMPRLMVVTVDTCNGPRAYAGLAFSYGEKVTEKWLRLTDQEWAKQISSSPFPDVPWMSDLLGK